MEVWRYSSFLSWTSVPASANEQNSSANKQNSISIWRRCNDSTSFDWRSWNTKLDGPNRHWQAARGPEIGRANFNSGPSGSSCESPAGCWLFFHFRSRAAHGASTEGAAARVIAAGAGMTVRGSRSNWCAPNVDFLRVCERALHYVRAPHPRIRTTWGRGLVIPENFASGTLTPASARTPSGSIPIRSHCWRRSLSFDRRAEYNTRSVLPARGLSPRSRANLRARAVQVRASERVAGRSQSVVSRPDFRLGWGVPIPGMGEG